MRKYNWACLVTHSRHAHTQLSILICVETLMTQKNKITSTLYFLKNSINYNGIYKQLKN